jgi:hypothetical protein
LVQSLLGLARDAARLDRDRCWDRDDAIVVRDDLRSRWCAIIFDRGNAIVVRDDL